MIDPNSLTWRAELSFVFSFRPELDAVVTVFSANGGAVSPRESEEMAPEWFDAGSLPLDQMWDDEAYWLPQVLADETLACPITYDEACKLVIRAELKTAGAAGPSS